MFVEERDIYSDCMPFASFENKSWLMDQDLIAFSLLPNNNYNIDDFLMTFEKDITVLVENSEKEMGFLKVDTLLKNISKYVIVANDGLVHSWTYLKRKCFALLDWTGCWNLYAMKCVDDKRLRMYNNYPIIDRSYVYKITLDPRTDTMLPRTATEEALPGSTFKDLSYCKIYVNMFVDSICEKKNEKYYYNHPTRRQGRCKMRM